jgi:hypothetical protein
MLRLTALMRSQRLYERYATSFAPHFIAWLADIAAVTSEVRFTRVAYIGAPDGVIIELLEHRQWAARSFWRHGGSRRCRRYRSATWYAAAAGGLTK